MCQSSGGNARGSLPIYLAQPVHFRLQSMIDRAWPSGKAPVFGTGIRGFESLRPSQIRLTRDKNSGQFYLSTKKRLHKRSKHKNVLK